MKNNTKTIKCQNDKEIIENQGMTIITLGKDLKKEIRLKDQEIKKNRLLMEFINNPEKIKSMLQHLSTCSQCTNKIDEFLKNELDKNIENCIYRNECIGCTKVCDEYQESVV